MRSIAAIVKRDPAIAIQFEDFYGGRCRFSPLLLR